MCLARVMSALQLRHGSGKELAWLNTTHVRSISPRPSSRRPEGLVTDTPGSCLLLLFRVLLAQKKFSRQEKSLRGTPFSLNQVFSRSADYANTTLRKNLISRLNQLRDLPQAFPFRPVEAFSETCGTTASLGFHLPTENGTRECCLVLSPRVIVMENCLVGICTRSVDRYGFFREKRRRSLDQIHF